MNRKNNKAKKKKHVDNPKMIQKQEFFHEHSENSIVLGVVRNNRTTKIKKKNV